MISRRFAYPSPTPAVIAASVSRAIGMPPAERRFFRCPSVESTSKGSTSGISPHHRAPFRTTRRIGESAEDVIRMCGDECS